MHIITLTFSDNKASAPLHMAAHKEWIQQGFQDGIFKLVSTLDGGKGGCIFADHNDSDKIQSFVDQDPFVQENVVQAHIQQIHPNTASDEFAFLLP